MISDDTKISNTYVHIAYHLRYFHVAGNISEANQLRSSPPEGTKLDSQSNGRVDATKVAISAPSKPAPVSGPTTSMDTAAIRETTVETVTVARAAKQQQLKDRAAAKRRKSVATAATGDSNLAKLSEPDEQSQEVCLPSLPLAQADSPGRSPTERVTRRRKSTAAPTAAATQTEGPADFVEERHVTFAKDSHASVTEGAHVLVTETDNAASAVEAPKRCKSIAEPITTGTVAVADAPAAPPLPPTLQVSPLFPHALPT